MQELARTPHILVSTSAPRGAALEARQEPENTAGKGKSKLPVWVIPVVVILPIALLVLAAFVVYLVKRERQGVPTFAPLLPPSVSMSAAAKTVEA